MVRRILYLLERPELCGGVKVVFQHAQLLRDAGLSVTVLGRGRKPSWAPFSGRYVNLDRGRVRLPDQDLVVATYWTTLLLARSLSLGPTAHFCQGYEGDYPHLQNQWQEIEAAYRQKVPTLVVAPHLGELVAQRFGRQYRLAPPPLDPSFRALYRDCPRTKPRILVQGIFECDWKGVPTALQALRILSEKRQAYRLVRVSLLPCSNEEGQILKAHRFYCRIRPKKVARILRYCDLLLFPSLDVEGFGLPLIEAFASGVPAVASDLPSTRFITNGHLPLCRVQQPEEMAARAMELLHNPPAWRRAREIGFELAQQFRADRVTGLLMEAVDWAVQTVGQEPFEPAGSSAP